MLTILFYGAPLLSLIIWGITMREYAKKNQLKEGYHQIWRCLKICLIAAIIATVLMFVASEGLSSSHGSPETGWMGSLILVLIWFGAATVIVFIVLIRGLVAYSKARSIESTTVEDKNDLLDAPF